MGKDATDEVLKRNVLATFGAHNLSRTIEVHRVSLSPKNIILHEDWSHLDKSFDADLALLEFDKGSIHFNDYVQPICLWGSDNQLSIPDSFVIGWGKSEDKTRYHEDTPKLVELKIKTNEECLPKEEVLAALSSVRTFCARSISGESGVCFGDSGGGLVIKVDHRHFLKGIVSSSQDNGFECDVTKDVVFTNVFKYTNWIKMKTGVALVYSDQDNFSQSSNQG